MLVPGLVLGSTLLAVACTSPAAAPEPTATAEPAPAQPTATAEPPRPTATPEATATPEVEVEAHGIYEPHAGAAVASIEERIFFSDVVVRAAFVSAGNGTLSFRAVEYLKGSGGPTFSVRADTAGRSAQWDSSEALLFLELSDTAGDGASGAASHFEFTDTTAYNLWPEYPSEARAYSGSLPEGYTVDSRNPVWLPAAPVAGASGASGDPVFIDAPLVPGGAAGAAGAESPTIELSDLRARIEWVEGGQGVGGYDLCIRVSLRSIRRDRDRKAYGNPRTLHEYEAEIAAGAPSGTDIYRYTFNVYAAQHGYYRYWVTGQDAALFEAGVDDDDDYPYNGYDIAMVTARPLPAGTYTVIDRRQGAVYTPCGYTTKYNRLKWTVTVTGSDDTLHEMLFDPDAAGGAPAYRTFTGVHGIEAAIDRIAYESNEVRIEVSPNNALAGQTIEFIELDGSVALTLYAAQAAVSGNTLSWNVATAPWENGDKLMVRISGRK